MAEEERADAGHLVEEESEEFDVSADDEDLDSAIQEALEAVEKGDEPSHGGAAAVEEADGAIPEDDNERLQAELASLRDRSMRTLADFENFRKRVARERGEELRYAVFEVLRDILPVIDNLERALASTGPVEDLKTGVELTLKQLQEYLRRHGVERIEAQGERFDPNLHEAVSRYEDAAVIQPTVSEELQTGYSMHERLLRPAMVTVAMPADGGDPAGQADAEAEPPHDGETASE